MNTKDEILFYLQEVVDLLEECAVQDIAKWYKEKLGLLHLANFTQESIQDELKGIRRSLVGMGSFSDTVLNPRNQSKMTRQEAGKKQIALVEKLSTAIEKVTVTP